MPGGSNPAAIGGVGNYPIVKDMSSMLERGKSANDLPVFRLLAQPGAAAFE